MDYTPDPNMVGMLTRYAKAAAANTVTLYQLPDHLTFVAVYKQFDPDTGTELAPQVVFLSNSTVEFAKAWLVEALASLAQEISALQAIQAQFTTLQTEVSAITPVLEAAPVIQPADLAQYGITLPGAP